MIRMIRLDGKERTGELRTAEPVARDFAAAMSGT